VIGAGVIFDGVSIAGSPIDARVAIGATIEQVIAVSTEI
jgi:hypothetical protein